MEPFDECNGEPSFGNSYLDAIPVDYTVYEISINYYSRKYQKSQIKMENNIKKDIENKAKSTIKDI